MHNMLMYMNNMLEGVDIDVMKNGFMQMFSGGVSAALQSFLYGVLTLICKVLGVFADLMNVVFYIFAGIDINSQNGSRYAIEVAGEKQNILDYFVLSETMRSAYFWLCVASVVLIVIFTIYKIIKQDYFEKSGPRSKGPIFRNVAISCISFLLVIPIFLVIIHASSLLAVVVMDMMGLNVNVLAGAKVFLLSWSDKGGMVSVVNSLYLTGKSGAEFTTMNNLDGRTLFTLLADKKSLSFASNLTVKNNDTTVKIISDKALNNGAWSDTSSLSEFGMMVGSKPTTAAFYWYIYLVGVIITIKSLYKMLLAMLQRIFKLMGLFLVAPSPISQYVLDDGQKFKSWLQQSIQEGLRLVSATMSFSIFLIALTLIGDISFTTALKASMSGTGVATRTILLANGSFTDTGNAWTDFEQSVEGFASADTLAKFFNNAGSTIENFGDFSTAVVADVAGWVKQAPGISDATQWLTDGLWALGDAFIKIFMLIGAGGAIMDLDQVLTPLISGGKSSLDAGQTGAAADGLVKGTMAVAGAVGGAAFGAITQGIMNKGIAAEAKSEAKVQVDKEKADAQAQVGSQSNAPQPGNGGNGPVGPAGPGDTASAPETVNNNQQNDDNDENVENVENQENVENLENPEENNNETKDEENDNNQSGTAQLDDPKPTNRLKSLVGGGMNLLGKAAKGVGKVASVGAKGVGTVAKGVSRASGAIGLTAALKAGFKAAGGAVATAVFGKDVVKSFSDARGTAVKEANASAAKRKEEIKQNEYTKLRKEQLDKANEVVSEKRDGVGGATEELNAAISQEKGAANELSSAQDEAAANQLTAETATKEVEGNDTDSVKNGKAIAKQRETVEAAKKENDAIEKKYGNVTEMEAAKKIAEESGDTQEAKKYETAINKYNENKNTITKGTKKITELETKQKQHKEALDVATGKNNVLSKMGFAYDASRDAVLSGIDNSISEIDNKLNDSTLTSEEKTKLEDQRNELVNTKSQVSNVSDATFNSAASARKANDNLRVSKENLSKAQAKYQSKHENTVQKRTALEGRMNELSNATQLVQKLDEATKKSPYGKDESLPGVRGTRESRRKNNTAKELAQYSSDSKKIAEEGNEEYISQAHSSVAGSKAINPSKVTLGSVNKYLNNRLNANEEKFKPHQDNFNAAIEEFNKDTQGKEIQITEGATFQLSEVTKNGQVDKQKLTYAKNLAKSTGNVDLEKSLDKLSEAHDDYNYHKKDYDTEKKNINVTRDALNTTTRSLSNEHANINQQHLNNEEKYRVATNQVQSLTEIINSGGKTPLTPQTINMIQSITGEKLRSNASSEKIVAAATKAREVKYGEQAQLIKNSEELRGQQGQIEKSFTNVISSALKNVGIKVETPKNDTKGDTTNNTNNVTNVNNNISNSNGYDQSFFDGNELPSSSGLGQSKDLNAYYERMQVEGIKHLEQIVQDSNRRQREMERDIDEIKVELKEDK